MSENGTVDEREARIGRNEALFRAVNQRMESLNEAFSVVAADEQFEIVCECGEITCIELFLVSTEHYREARADPTLFILLAGHEDATVEAVVEADHGAYVIVRKHPGGPAELAAEQVPDK